MFSSTKFPTIHQSIGFSLVFFLLLISCKGNEPETSSDYISEVFEYVYAPGQHANLALESDKLNFIGIPKSDKGFLYLGGFGGFVVAGFNHDVKNNEGADFEVYALQGASPEPAVVYVMQDVNGDGKPNETWYELKGNQFSKTKRNYWVRYYKALSDTNNIKWKDSDGIKGELISGYGKTSSSKWWWSHTTTDSITFHGTRLPDSYDNSSSGGAELWNVPAGRFTWGYAENMKGFDFDAEIGANKLDISNAIDSLGNEANLSTIRFIKVQTGVFQQAGWMNEVSSEVRGAKDLKN
ncbi:MAG: PKD domain-containing protein [Paludibacter sp.]|nr:PKD domain-containing protein [Paludibacter sp.]